MLVKEIRRAVILVSAFFCVSAYALPAEDVRLVNDRGYFSPVHELLHTASKSIYVVMYSAHYYDRYPDSPSNILLADLAQAVKRGVAVKVILEQEEPLTPGSKAACPEHNRRVSDFLKRNNVPYSFDRKDITTHAKLIVIDGIYTVVGSTNWSYSAITKNHEASVIIKSEKTSEAYIRYFNGIEKDIKLSLLK